MSSFDNLILSSRQIKIFRIITEAYIRQAVPISSNAILAQDHSVGSSATVRNECAYLEEQGLLEKIHSSSGRVPSSLGYQYYVAHLLKPPAVNDLKVRLTKLFANRDLSVQKTLDQVGEILSELTHLTTMVAGPNLQQESLIRLEFLSLPAEQGLIIFILSNGHVDHKTIQLADDLKQDFENAVAIFNKRLCGTAVFDIVAKFEALRHILEAEINHCEAILAKFLHALLDLSQIQQSTHGVHYMLDNPEYNNPAKIKRILNFIEKVSPFEYFQTRNKSDPAIHLKIGAIADDEDLEDIAIVTKNYQLACQNQGSLALIGPKRMEYNKLYDILNWIGEQMQAKNNRQKNNAERKTTYKQDEQKRR